MVKTEKQQLHSMLLSTNISGVMLNAQEYLILCNQIDDKKRKIKNYKDDAYIKPRRMTKVK